MARRRASKSELLDELPPQDLAAEVAVLGSIVLAPSLVLPKIRAALDPRAFYSDGHQVLYTTLLSMEGQAMDAVTILDTLRRQGLLERVGGAGRLAEIAQSVPTAAHVLYYADIVMRCYAKRLVIRIATDVLRAAYEETSTPDDLYDTLADRGLSGLVWLRRYGLLAPRQGTGGDTNDF